MKLTTSEYEDAMRERQRMLEEAIHKAETGVATEEDFNIIRYHCGVCRRPQVTLETLSIKGSE